MKEISHVIYDSITKQDIIFYKGELTKKCKELGLDNTKISRLKNGTYDFIDNRFCMSDRKSSIILTLKDYDTDEEFECVCNKTIFIHTGLPYNESDSKYFYELKSKRQKVATICNRLVYIKEYGKPEQIMARTKKEYLQSVQQLRTINNSQHRIRSNLRNRINSLIKENKSYKVDNLVNLIGCSKQEFKEYLESKFYDNISWENYGSLWHVDHIIPCFTFDLTNEDDVRKCFHYTNLRPLLATENLSRPKTKSYYLNSDKS